MSARLTPPTSAGSGVAAPTTGAHDALCPQHPSEVFASLRCPACHAPTVASRRYVVNEYMFDTGEAFHYEPCGGCGSRVIADPPADLARYYPRSYMGGNRRRDALLRVLRRLGMDARVRAFARLRAAPTTRVLDVGCGSGDFLRLLAARGYGDLTAVDPFLPFESRAEGPCSFWKGELGDLLGSQLQGERFGAVTLHHVIEHAPDTQRFLADAAAALAPGGRLLVRTPLVDSWAARRYGARWFQHDAPRHLVLLTRDGLGRAAAAAGLRLTESWRDEGRWQAWSGAVLAAGENPFRHTGLATTIGRFRYSAAARRRNRAGTGDQGCFVFTRADDGAA